MVKIFKVNNPSFFIFVRIQLKTITIKGTINFWMIFYKICQCESAAAKLWDVRQVIMEQPFALHDPKSPKDRKQARAQL